MTCKNCIHSNFKSSAERDLYQCLNDKFCAMLRISLVHVNEVFRHPEPIALMNDIEEYARILVDGDFGCIFYEAEQ